MATYFGYAEREADSYINWAAIGKSMSDMLAQEAKIREEKKAAIDQESIEYGQQLDKAPQGEHKGMNQWALEYANNAQQARLMQDKLLKSGQLNVKDYMVMRQNIMDGTSQAFDLMKEYQDEYKSKMERDANGISSEIEPWLMSEAEGFSNFSESSLYINPTDGTVNIGKMVVGPDGVKKMSDNPNDFSTINSLRNRIKDRYDRFDVKANVSKYVSTLGTEINALASIKDKYQRGSVSELLDITQRTNLPVDAQGIIKTFEQAENDMLQSLIVNPNDAASVLLDAVDFVPGTTDVYTPTWSEEEAKADPSKILYKTDPKSGRPTPQLSDDQRQVVMDHLKTQARLMYDKKEQIQIVGANERPQQQQWQAMLAKDNAEKARIMKDWQLIRTGTPEQKKAALDAITGSPSLQAKGLMKLSLSADGNQVLFEYSDPKFNKPVNITDSPEDFFRAGTEAFGQYTDADLKKYGTGDRYYGGGGLSSSRKGEPAKVDYSSQINIMANSAEVQEDDPTLTANKLIEQGFGDLGFSITPRSEYGISGKTDFVDITASNGTTQSFNVDDLSSQSAMQNFLKQNADPNLASQKFGGSGVISNYSGF